MSQPRLSNRQRRKKKKETKKRQLHSKYREQFKFSTEHLEQEIFIPMGEQLRKDIDKMLSDYIKGGK